MPRGNRVIRERYSLDRSPLSQKPTQKEVAELLGESKDSLRKLVNYKDTFVVRRTIKDEKKVRNLAYPVSRLRRAHEKLKYQLNKIKQPNYLYSPRAGKSQRDNASAHISNRQYLTLDIKQFYPSTTEHMIKQWLVGDLNMYPDVANLIARLATVDGIASFGSPLTPVLVTLVHRNMFDAIASLATTRGLGYSVWVDDITISGEAIPKEFLTAVRDLIRTHGLKSHKIKYRTGKRPVFITGIGILGDQLVPKNSLNKKLKELFEQFNDAISEEEKEDSAKKLLTVLGYIRHVSGPTSQRGQRIASQMNSVRQDLTKFRRMVGMKHELKAGKLEPVVLEPLPFEV